MTERRKNSAPLERFDEVLAIFGPDPARWPEDERSALSALARSDSSAAQLLAEATALDKVLALAPAGEAGDALKQRIVAAAVNDGSRDARVVPMAAVKAKRRGLFGAGTSAAWPAAAMAASFALGLYLGIAGLGTATVGTALDLAAVNGALEESDAVEFLSDAGVSESEGII
jgi:hypothetical protein